MRRTHEWILDGCVSPWSRVAAMQIFLSAFDEIPDPRADNARHDLGELLVIAFVAVLCGATTCAGMATFGRAKESLFRGFLNLKHAIPSHDTFSAVLRMLDPKALDAAFGKVLAEVAALMRDGDVIAIDGKALRGARGKAESARTRMMVCNRPVALAVTHKSCVELTHPPDPVLPVSKGS